jgi:hypothetical protein
VRPLRCSMARIRCSSERVARFSDAKLTDGSQRFAEHCCLRLQSPEGTFVSQHRQWQPTLFCTRDPASDMGRSIHRRATRLAVSDCSRIREPMSPAIFCVTWIPSADASTPFSPRRGPSAARDRRRGFTSTISGKDNVSMPPRASSFQIDAPQHLVRCNHGPIVMSRNAQFAAQPVGPSDR